MEKAILNRTDGEALRAAVIAAHRKFGFKKDINVANYDDEYSFVDPTTGGYWVEAFVFVSDKEVEKVL